MVFGEYWDEGFGNDGYQGQVYYYEGSNFGYCGEMYFVCKVEVVEEIGQLVQLYWFLQCQF